MAAATKRGAPAMKRSYLMALTLVIALLAMAAWLSQNITISDQRIELGASPEARNNPYLAMEYFLLEQEISVKSLPSLTRIATPEAGQHTLILLSENPTVIDQHQAQLLSWVAQGGHLILSAKHEPLANNNDSLLNSLGIKKQLTATLEPSTTQTDTTQEASAATTENHAPPQLTRLYLENELSPAYLSLDTQFHLQDTQNRAHAWANSQDATHLLQLSHGQGLITVLTDLDLWQNSRINQYEHAWLLWYLSQETQVILFNPPVQQGLLKLLWHYYAAACLLGLALLALGIWHAAPRFAPIRQPRSRARRRLVEHLHAAALFNLRYNGQRSLLIALQKDIKQRAQLRHPGFSRLAVAEQWQVLQQLSRQPISSISHSMRPPPSKKLSAQAFTQHVACLQQLRNAL